MRVRWPFHFWATVLLLGVTAAFSKVSADRKPEDLAQPLDTISRNIEGFVASDNPPLTDGVLAELKPTSYLARTYTRQDGSGLDLFIAYYAQQRAGESMHSPKHCLPGAGWEIWDYGNTPIRAAGQAYIVNQYSISREGQRRLVLYWYQSKQRIVASEYLGKLLLARDSLLRNSTAGSIVRIIVPDNPAALAQSRLFAAEIIPQMARCFRQ